VSLELVDDLLHEQNGLLFIHGISNSGKNYALMGKPNVCSETGLVQKVFESLFKSLANCLNRKFVSAGVLFSFSDFIFNNDLENSAQLLKPMHDSFSLQEANRIMFDEIQEKRQNNHPYRNARSNPRFKYVPSDSFSDITIENARTNHTGYSVFISCIELHNDRVYDLLSSLNRYTATLQDAQKSEITALDERGQMIELSQLERTKLEVNSTAEALEYIVEANAKRFGRFTDGEMKHRRSQFIITITLVKLECGSSSNGRAVYSYKQNHLSLVDLVGREKLAREDMVNMIELREDRAKIGSSLLALRTCLEAVKHNSLYPAYGNVLFFKHVLESLNKNVIHFYFDLNFKGSAMLELDVD
jgi:hypothetical protein